MRLGWRIWVVLIILRTDMVIVTVSIRAPWVLFPFYIGAISAFLFSSLATATFTTWKQPSCLFVPPLCPCRFDTPKQVNRFLCTVQILSLVSWGSLTAPSNWSVCPLMPRGLIFCLLTVTWVALIDLRSRLCHVVNVVLLRLWVDLSLHRNRGRKSHLMRRQRPSTIWFRSLKMRHIGGEPRLPAKQRKHLPEWLRPWHAAGIAPCLLASSY